MTHDSLTHCSRLTAHDSWRRIEASRSGPATLSSGISTPGFPHTIAQDRTPDPSRTPVAPAASRFMQTPFRSGASPLLSSGLCRSLLLPLSGPPLMPDASRLSSSPLLPSLLTPPMKPPPMLNAHPLFASVLLRPPPMPLTEPPAVSDASTGVWRMRFSLKTSWTVHKLDAGWGNGISAR